MSQGRKPLGLDRAAEIAPTVGDWLGHATIAKRSINGHASREDLRKAAEALG